MAADVPMPREDDPAGPGAYRARVVEQHMHATLFLLNYLAHVEDSGFEVFREDSGTLGGVTGVVRDDGYGWGAQCADELRNTRPSDAAGVAAAILDHAHRWCELSTFTATPLTPTADFLCTNAIPLLDALCPAEHRTEADMLLRKFWNEMVWHDHSSLQEAATRYPIATIHIAAAMTAAVFAEQGPQHRLLNQLELTNELQRILA